MKHFILLFGVVISISVQAQEIISPSQLEQQIDRRQRAIESQLLPSQDAINGSISTEELKRPLPDSNKAAGHCFPIKTMQLKSADQALLPGRFYRYFRKTLKLEKIRLARRNNSFFHIAKSSPDSRNSAKNCFGAQDIEKLTIRLQNILIDKGYITTRVLVPEQNLTTGNLLITIAVGKVGNIAVNRAEQNRTHANRATVRNALPLTSGDILNLRDITVFVTPVSISAGILLEFNPTETVCIVLE